MKTWGRGGTAQHILNLGTRWRWVVSFTPRAFHPRRKNPRYPLNRRLGGPQSRSESGGEEKKSLCPCRESYPGRPARSLVTNLTELSRLLYTTFTWIIHIKLNVKLLMAKSEDRRSGCSYPISRNCTVYTTHVKMAMRNLYTLYCVRCNQCISFVPNYEHGTSPSPRIM
jgi:hypothetical protein